MTISSKTDDEKSAIFDHANYRKKRQHTYSLTIAKYLFLLGVFFYFIFVPQEHGVFNIFNNYTKYSTDAIERLYLETLSTSNLASNWSKVYTSIPHLAGEGLELVNFTQQKFEEYGLTTEVETYDVYFNTPVSSSLKLLSTKANSSTVYEASLKEDVLSEDPTTGGDDLVPAFHGYSASGNVTGSYIYVNYGTKKDFEVLDTLGVNFTNKICIARYGDIYRGLKVKFAQEAGCSGVLIYSDPGDDYFQEVDGYKPYPKGPARNPSSLQRGSVLFLSQGPGDPTTPGKASQGPEVVREDPSDYIPRIPSLPISFREVKPILEKLNGYGVNCSAIEKDGKSWVGGLPGFDYWSGPNPSYELNLYNNQSYEIKPIYNVYGTMAGTDPKAGYILVGNHRDAWIKGGAGDPNSGSASILEVIRALNEVSVGTGWKPKRTIVFASWDGEELGLLGSTEYGEKNKKDLKSNCVGYLNVDISVSGTNLNVQSSPFLNKIILESLKQVNYDDDMTLYDHYFSKHEKIGILGSGSDYTVFLEHLGIPSLDMGFTSGDKDPVYHYHSNYDSYHWMNTLMDPGFKYHNKLSQLFGLSLLKLSERQLLNTHISDYSVELKGYFDELVSKLPDSWLGYSPSVSGMRTGGGGCMKMRKDMGELTKPTLGELVNGTSLEFNKFINTSITIDSQVDSLQTQYDHIDELPFYKRIALRWKIFGFNKKLQYFERIFLHKKGLKGRPWFKHVVYASGRDTGYEGFAFPGLKEALDDSNVEDFYYWTKVIDKIGKKLNKLD